MRRTLVLLSPYGPGVWARMQNALASVADLIIIDPGDEADLDETARRVLRQAPPRFYLAGLCIGGYVALAIHRLAPESVAGLALINTSAAPDTELQARIRRERIEKLRQKIPEGRFPSSDYVAHAVNWLLGRGSCRVAEASALLAETPITRSLAQQQAMLARPDSRLGLSAILVPTLVVAGEEDRVCSPSCSREIARGVANASLHIFGACGHLAPLEQPHELAEAMLRWLGGPQETEGAIHQHEEQS